VSRGKVIVLALLAFLLAGGVAAAVVIAPWDDGDDGGSGSTDTTSTTDQEIARARAAHAACDRALGPLLKQLRELDSRLDVGLNYDEYTTEVGDIRVVYDSVVEQAEDPACLTSVGIPAEEALNEYAKAAGKWGDCFDDINCDTDSIEPTLRKYWDRASTSIDTAQQALEDMRAPS
jgi:hypothetical protein